MEKRLPLPRPATCIASPTMLFQLGDMAADRAPSFNLPQIVRMTPARIVTAIPLKPAARVVGMDPSFVPPNFQRLRGAHAEIVEAGARPIRRKLCASEPARRKFLAAIGHVLSPEHAELEHFARGQLGSEPGTEIFTGRFRSPIGITFLHSVVDDNAHRLHPLLLALRTFRATAERSPVV